MTERTAYRLSEVRAALGISRSTMYRWIEDGKIKVTKVCGRSFVMREDHPAPPIKCQTCAGRRGVVYKTFAYPCPYSDAGLIDTQ
jgi:excisionase family DNA binding protein